MNYVVGDIHGEITKLHSLISFILQYDNNPKITFVGDYLDKGENPKEVLEYLIEISINMECKFLIGNHEYIWLNIHKNNSYIEYLNKYGGIQTVKSFGHKTILETKDFIDQYYQLFFSNLISYYILGKYFISHSGIDYEYFNTEPNEIPIDKLLFNRYSFIQTNRAYLNKYTAIFGHTGFFFPYVDEYKIGIDTAACFLKAQPLTAFCIEKQKFLYSTYKIEFLSKYQRNICPNIPRDKPWRML